MFNPVCVCIAAAVPGIKGFDEDSIASQSTTHDETQDSHVTNGIANPSHPSHAGGYMLAASYWPKVNSDRTDPVSAVSFWLFFF